ncbi:hypothetical protein [Chryseobacterium sp.]|uniref:hypothetical protein n=1 Tax=Chryseobacterium sp. TaxID=1871047 RepID=UPI002FCB01C8
MDDTQKIISLLNDILSRIDDIEKSLNELKEKNSESLETVEHEIYDIKQSIKNL